MKFFADACVPIGVVRVLRELEDGNTYEHLGERFDTSIKDVEWLPVVAQDDPQPVILSGDLRIRRNRIEREVLRRTNLMAFFLARKWTDMPIDDQVERIKSIWKKVTRMARNTMDPTIYQIPVKGRQIQKVCLTGQLKPSKLPPELRDIPDLSQAHQESLVE